MALVVLSAVEQRLDAVRAVLAGADVVEVAARVGCIGRRRIGRRRIGQTPHRSDAASVDAASVAHSSHRRRRTSRRGSPGRPDRSGCATGQLPPVPRDSRHCQDHRRHKEWVLI
ncbi:hypothetical protein EKO23_20095 [Nocardioides guangzhouensis]|uniref:Uncharacterized protein n=1 Tax=Nocardioides guangzhouensis TaxID=2497878 RepID=A0A4Q4Z6Q0_9ACTN|nr:hypothetical protein EKO23_20095 [Nocardioides guangzhouensis]